MTFGKSDMTDIDPGEGEEDGAGSGVELPGNAEKEPENGEEPGGTTEEDGEEEGDLAGAETTLADAA